MTSAAPTADATSPSWSSSMASTIVHLGDIAHTLTEEKIGEIGPVDVACVPDRRAAERRRRPPRSSPSWTRRSWSRCRSARTRRACEPLLARFLHEMGTTATEPQATLLDHPERPPRGDDDRPAGVARQGLGPPPASSPTRPGVRRLSDRPDDDAARRRRPPGRGRPRPVRDLGVRRHVPDDEVRAQARHQRAPVREAERRRRVHGRRDEHLGRVEAAASGPPPS